MSWFTKFLARVETTIANKAIAELVNINLKLKLIMAQVDDLKTDLASLKQELDAAKDRDSKIQSTLTDVQNQLAALQANPPADLTEAIQSVRDDIAEAQS